MKNAKRLDYAGLLEVLGQRGTVDAQRLRIAYETATQGNLPFPEVLVGDDLVGDWELSRIVCDLYGLPFVPTDIYEPDESLADGLDADFLRQHRLVPVGRHADLLTVAMPALVPADVLGALSAAADLHVLPVVGTVDSNNRWLAQNLVAEAPPAALPAEDELTDASGAGWANLFDEGDAAVLMGLNSEEPEAPVRKAPEPPSRGPAAGGLPPLPPLSPPRAPE